MTKTIDYRKIVESYNPNAKLLMGYDKYIVSVNFKEEQIEVFYSLWGVVNELMLKKQLTYDESLKELIEIVHKANDLKTSDITYYFYEDLPNPQLN